MLSSKEVAVALRENGYKVTPQRLAVYASLAKTKKHPNAETLFKSLQPMFPTMSFATVYKSVEIMERINLIKILNTGEDSFRYDADVSEHQHIQCTSCGKVEDVHLDNVETRKIASEASGYDVEKQEMYFYGVCPACRAKKSN